MTSDLLIQEWLAEFTPELREEFEERAGIMEFEGALPRLAAEFASMALLFRRHSKALAGVHLTQVGVTGLRLTTDTTLLSREGCREVPLGELPGLVAASGGTLLLVTPEK